MNFIKDEIQQAKFKGVLESFRDAVAVGDFGGLSDVKGLAACLGTIENILEILTGEDEKEEEG